MRAESSATAPNTIAVAPSSSLPRPSAPASVPARRGTLLALLGVVTFSLTFPSTAWGLESFGPWSLVALRSLLAAVLSGGFLLAARVRVPPGSTGRGSPSWPAGWWSASRC